MKQLLALILLISTTFSSAQKKRSTILGKTSLEELQMTVYAKDSTASAVVLYEHANYYVDELNKYDLRTDYYFRIKILKKEGLEKATVKIPLYGKERVLAIKAKTSNLSENGKKNDVFLLKDKIFTKQVNPKWKEVSFTMPNVKVGSVVEFVYSVISPYSTIDDWYFQSDIPKIKSDFTAAILGNWKYHIRVVGFFKLDRSEARVKKRCVYIEGVGYGDCSVLSYGVDTIPAFKSEDYMLSKENYISKLSFELESFTNTQGVVEKYTKTWKNADKKLKYNFLDNQSSKKRYFKKNIIPSDMLTIVDDLERAKKVYELVKANFIWNGKHWPNEKIRVKKAYESKTGNVFDINLSLFNALQAVNIESQLVLLATRDKGLATKLYPVINEFNYLAVKATINGKEYFLDATQKLMPFGLLQFQALAGDVRMMDFKEGSYWGKIKLHKKNSTLRKLKLNLTEEGLKGDLNVVRTGYFAMNRRNEILGKEDEVILDDFETKYPDFEVDSYKVNNLEEADKRLVESFKVEIETNGLNTNTIRVNPFFLGKLSSNPFKLEERNYPVNFGYARSNTYMVSINIPENYEIIKLPETKAISLPNRGGNMILNVKKKAQRIDLHLRIAINKNEYSNIEYQYLKEFYNQLIKYQNSFIELKKR